MICHVEQKRLVKKIKKKGTKESASENLLAQLNVDFNSFLCFLNKSVHLNRKLSGFIYDLFIVFK